MKLVKLSMLISVLLFSCGEKGDELQNLKKDVMAIHDEVMPKMGDMRKVSKSLQMKAETLDSISGVELKSLASDIDSANEFMMQWMRQYEPNLEGTQEELLRYYTEQMQSIRLVKDSMNQTLAKGKKALGE